MRRCTIVGAAVSLIAAASISTGASTAAEPFVTKIGDFTVIAVHTADIEMSSDLVKNGDPGEIRKIIPSGKISASINAFVVKTPTHVILVDSGKGETGALIDQMEKEGISPNEVDLVLITHGHFDHVGGLVRNGKAVFGKARVLIAEKEAASYSDEALGKIPQDYLKYYQPMNNVLSAYKERIATFTPGSKIDEGISSVDLSGHTPGHTGYLFESRGKKILIAGDFLHITALQLVHPDYSLVYDSDIARAAEVRKAFLETVSRDKTLIAASHIEYPGIGYISRSGATYIFSPLK